MLRIAREKQLLNAVVHDLRNYTADRHRSVDDRPYGGGPGMVLKPEPVVNAVRAICALQPALKMTVDGGGDPEKNSCRLLMMCPRGRRFNQQLAHELSLTPRLFMIAGHYEGYDERIVESLNPELISIGDYVLTGGELPALVVIDSVVRLIPGVLGDAESVRSESFAPDNEGMLEYPQYTRPAEFEGRAVPEVLISGDHARIATWRREQARLTTRQQRPDLL